MSGITRLKLNKKQIAEYKELSINSRIQPVYKAIEYHYSKDLSFFHLDMSGDYKKLFMDKFGKVDYCYTTWYRSYNWFVEFMGAIFTISSSVRGTTYYLVDDKKNENVSKLCYDFCMEMNKFLKTEK